MSRFALDDAHLADVQVRPVHDAVGEHAALVHAAWRLTDPGFVVRIHVDDAVVDVLTDAAQRDAWLVCDRRVAHHVRLTTYPRAYAHEAFTMQPRPIPPVAPLCDAAGRFSYIAHQSLPPDALLRVTIDGQPHVGIPLWPADTPRCGLGSMLGMDALGVDGAMAPGLGQGQLGVGPCGIDGQALAIALPILNPQPHNIELQPTSATGAVIGDPVTFTFTPD